MEDMKGPIEGLMRLYQQMDERTSPTGGLGNLFGLQRKLRETLGEISVGELVMLLREIQRAQEALNQLQEDIVEIHALKEAFDTAASHLATGKPREQGGVH